MNSKLGYTSAMKRPKLIMLYGFASSGKTTIAKMYLEKEKLALVVEGDKIVSQLGKWRKNEQKARDLVYSYTKTLAEMHVQAGYNVVLPYLLLDIQHANTFSTIAKENNANFLEIYIKLDKKEAVRRLLKRGVWGEDRSPQLSESDLPEIYELFENMKKAMQKRKNVHVINSVHGDIRGSFSQFINIVKQ